MSRDDEEKVISLTSKRREKNRLMSQLTKSDATRILELETEVYKLVDLIYELEHQLRQQEKNLQYLISILKKHSL